MNALQKIDFAFSETFQQHPESLVNAQEFLYGAMFLDYKMISSYITKKNNARQLMSEVSKQDIIRFVLIESIKIFNAITEYFYESEEMKKNLTPGEYLYEVDSAFPEYSTLIDEIEEMLHANDLDVKSKNPDEKINLFIFYKHNCGRLKALANIVANCRYQRGEQLKRYIDLARDNDISIGQYQGINLIAKIQKDAGVFEVAKDVQINQAAFNKCLMDVLSGSQLKNKHNQYALEGTLYASQDIGKRPTQEDSVLILTHPKEPNFKLLVVSDGMGGVDHGEIASQYTVEQLARWFETLPEEYYFYADTVQQELNKKIALISKNIYETYNKDYRGVKAGATVVAGIIGATKTIISTVGDSRAYIASENHLQLLTRDESFVWPQYIPPHKMSAKELNDLRFNIRNNQILKCIGYDIEDKEIQTIKISNDQYERLILLTDGVTDLLSQERIFIISQSQKPEQIAELLIKEAISKSAVRQNGGDEYHRAIIEAGKDNASAAVYIRR